MAQPAYLRFVVTLVALGCGLTACAQPVTPTAPEQNNSTVITTVTVTASNDADNTSVSNEDACAASTGAQALEEAIQQIPPPFPSQPLDAENQWSRNSPTDTYDPCAAFSWISLHIDQATSSSPYQIVFFHHGAYAGRAVDTSFAFPPRINEVSETAIEVGFSWPEDDEPNAMATVKATSTYSLDESTGKIIREGELPPRVEPAD